MPAQYQYLDEVLHLDEMSKHGLVYDKRTC